MTGTFAWMPVTMLAVAAASAQEPIRVGAWNLEFLGSPQDRAGEGKGVARDPGDLAGQIRAMDVDVLALSEIQDDDPDAEERRNRVLTAAFAALNLEPGNDWEYVLFAGRWRDSTDQLTGLAWNREKVAAVGRPLRVAVSDVTTDRFAEWHRTPHAMKFQRRGQERTDFVVVPIHMKAGAGADDVEQRGHEAESLLVELAEVRAHFRDEDIVLIGDFNFRGEGGRPRDEPAGRVYRERGFFDLNYGDRGTHITGWALDRCYIPRSQRENEFEGVERIEILVPDDALAFRRRFSDHWPVVLQFVERADDDGS